MNEEERAGTRRSARLVWAGALIIAAVGGGLLTRLLIPPPSPSPERPSRPIVQIVRPQPGLPDLSDLVDRLCPSVAIIVPHGADPEAAGGGGATPAFAVSADGWLLASAGALPAGSLDAVFGDGRRARLSEVRTDPVSGLAIVEADGPLAAPLSFSDQAFPRVGQFGLVLGTPAGSGCSARMRMIASDFLADGGGASGYFRVQAGGDPWSGGIPFVGSDGRLLGVAAADPAGTLIPAPVAAVIVDELIRNSLAPTTGFGFRAIDYGAPLSARLGIVRSGAGIALVEPGSGAARAGLQAGDIVIAVNDIPVSSASELNRTMDSVQGGASLAIARRDHQLKVTIARTPARPAAD